MSQARSDEGIDLIPLATVSVAGGDRYKIDDGPFGNRVIAGIREGRWEGERLRLNIVGPGADWAMPGPGGRCCSKSAKLSRPTMVRWSM